MNIKQSQILCDKYIAEKTILRFHMVTGFSLIGKLIESSDDNFIVERTHPVKGMIIIMKQNCVFINVDLESTVEREV